MGGTSKKEMWGVGFAGSSPPCLCLGRERAAVDVDVGPERGSPRYSRCTIGCHFRFWKKEAGRRRRENQKFAGHIKFDGTKISVLGIPSQYSAFQLPASDAKSENTSCNDCTMRVLKKAARR